MTGDAVERIASALLYEGYLLYPYRPSAVKNRQRFNFGVIYPDERHGPAEMLTECLVRGGPDAALDVRVRFLHLRTRTEEHPGGSAWQEAMEREVRVDGAGLAALAAAPRRLPFVFPAADGSVGRLRLQGEVELSAAAVGDGVARVQVRIANLTPAAAGPDRDDALLQSLVSAHTILRVSGGEFPSMIDPPETLRAAAAACRNVGAWPVLAGEEGSHDSMLASPIIVYDYPRIAPESPGEFFDGTEIDELLSLRILTLTDEEKREMGAADERARRLLERTEAMGAEELMRLHGTLREIRSLEDA